MSSGAKMFGIPQPMPELGKHSILSKSLAVISWLDIVKEHPDMHVSIHDTLKHIIEFLGTVERFKVESQQFGDGEVRLSSEHEICQPESLVMAFKAFTKYLTMNSGKSLQNETLTLSLDDKQTFAFKGKEKQKSSLASWIVKPSNSTDKHIVKVTRSGSSNSTGDA